MDLPLPSIDGMPSPMAYYHSPPINLSRPQCSQIYQVSSEVGSTVLIHLSLNLIGILSNICLLSVFSGRAKLGTASFTYIRIVAIVQFVFFIVPFPLKLLTEHYQRGQTWIAANFLPLVLGLFHFSIASLTLCFAVRLQLLINYVRRCRRWNSLGWVAWRKICWILPFGIIANVSLCFEFNLDYEICLLGNRTHAIGRARLSEAVKGDIMKLEFIRAIPMLVYGLTAFFSITFVLSERCILPKLGSPYAAKHAPLLENLRPILLAFILSHSIVPITYTVYLINGELLTDSVKLALFGVSYSLPFPMIFILSRTFRSHVFHIITNYCQSRSRTRRKDSTIRKVTKHIARGVAYSKLEMDNSEYDDRLAEYRAQNLRSVLKDDAIYRIRFSMPQNVDVIEEEDESLERRRDLLSVEEGIEMQEHVSGQYMHTRRMLDQESAYSENTL